MTRFPRLAASAWTLIIILACSIPGSDLPSVNVNGVDKIGHFLLFAVYGWLWMAALRYPLVRRIAVVAGSGLLLAVGTEIYQGWLPWERSPDPLDALSNVIGLSAAVAAYAVLRSRPGNFDAP